MLSKTSYKDLDRLQIKLDRGSRFHLKTYVLVVKFDTPSFPPSLSAFNEPFPAGWNSALPLQAISVLERIRLIAPDLEVSLQPKHRLIKALSVGDSWEYPPLNMRGT